MKCPLACTLFNFIYKAAFHRAQRIDFFPEKIYFIQYFHLAVLRVPAAELRRRFF